MWYEVGVEGEVGVYFIGGSELFAAVLCVKPALEIHSFDDRGRWEDEGVVVVVYECVFLCDVGGHEYSDAVGKDNRVRLRVAHILTEGSERAAVVEKACQFSAVKLDGCYGGDVGTCESDAIDKGDSGACVCLATSEPVVGRFGASNLDRAVDVVIPYVASPL